MELTIKNVPEDDRVIAEILANAEATIRNYHQAIIFEVTEAKVAQLNDVVNSFRTANVRAKSEVDSPTNPIV
jgi:hypothetical protein